MKTVWNSLVAAFTMYSKIPMPNVNLTEENTKYSLCFFPLVGVVIGAILCGWRIAYPYLCNGDFLPAVVFVIVPVIVSGATHVDGFIDTVDAICSKKTVEGKLAILKDTHTGSFAIIMTLSYFLVALGVWSEMPIDAVPVLAMGFVMSRALSGLAIVLFPHARTSKLRGKIKANKKILGLVMAFIL
jgi:adenosylcobinamide-GDP ribazoletransferase